MKHNKRKQLVRTTLLILPFLLIGCGGSGPSAVNQAPSTPPRSSLSTPPPVNTVSPSANQGYPQMDPFQDPNFWQKNANSYSQNMKMASNQANQLNDQAQKARMQDQQNMKMLTGAIGQIASLGGGMLQKMGANQAPTPDASQGGSPATQSVEAPPSAAPSVNQPITGPQSAPPSAPPDNAPVSTPVETGVEDVPVI